MRKAGEIISALFRERFGPEFVETAGMFSSWNRIVTEVWSRSYWNKEDSGPEDIPAAVHSRIRELERGVLIVEADHPGWIQILQTKQEALLSVFQRRYPELGIRGIGFRLSQEPFQSPSSSNHTADVNTTPPGAAWTHPGGGERPPRDEEFSAALKRLEASVKKRNAL